MSGYSQAVRALLAQVRRAEPGALKQLIASSASDATLALQALLEDRPLDHRIFRPILRELVKREVLDPTPYLRRLLQNPLSLQEQHVVIMAARDFLEADGAIPMLCDILFAPPGDITRYTRNQAACALAIVKDDAGLYRLAVALRYDNDEDVRRSAAYGLSMSHQPLAATVLLHYLEFLLGDGRTPPDRALQWHAQPIIHALHRALRRKLPLPDADYALHVLSKWLYIYTNVPEPEVKRVLNRLPGSVADRVVEQWQDWQQALAKLRHEQRIFR